MTSVLEQAACEHSSKGRGGACAQCSLWALNMAMRHADARGGGRDYDTRTQSVYYVEEKFDSSRLKDFCDCCRAIFLQPPEIWSNLPSNENYNWPAKGHRHWNQHHNNFQELAACADQEVCALCHLVVDLLQVTPGLIEPLRVEASNNLIQVSIERYVRGQINPIRLNFDFGNELPGLQFRVVAVKGINALSSSVLGESTATERSFEQARQWLENCQAFHRTCDIKTAICDKDAKLWLPTRLVYVGYKSENSLSLQLSSNLESSTRYLALSHCWGGADIYKLKMENLNSLLAGIDSKQLPKTFQHAIKICHELGFRYIWIDSLCIVQDSREDWAREAAVMGKVYSRAECTIAATGSQNSHDGIFFKRPQMPLLQCHIPCNPFDALDENVVVHGESVSIVPMNWDRKWQANIRDYAYLNARGWTFQERLLSRRILHFGRLGLAWECTTMSADEDCIQGYPAGDFYMEHQPMKPTCSAEDEFSAWHKWLAFVEDYSERNLTFHSDKLVAISAVAESLQPFLKSEYCAGLWRETFAYELNWIVDWEDLPREVELLADEYCAPSWSWASNTKKVFFPLSQSRFVHHQLLVDVIDVVVDTLGSNPFGPAKSAEATLFATLRHCTVVPVAEDAKCASDHIWNLEGEGPYPLPFTTTKSTMASMDRFVPLFGQLRIPVVAVPVMLQYQECDNIGNHFSKAAWSGVLYGILLQRSHENELFRRVGSFSMGGVSADHPWLGKGGKQRIRMI